jgi:hypothetical protein
VINYPITQSDHPITQSDHPITQSQIAIAQSLIRSITQFGLLLTTAFALACGSPPTSPPVAVAAVRPLGTWQGTGSRTIGITNESGRFRVKWETKEGPMSGGSFRLTVHSAVSGRPLQVIVDHRGAGGATVDFADDPRPYNLMVDSAVVEWTISVEEIVAGRAP